MIFIQDTVIIIIIMVDTNCETPGLGYEVFSFQLKYEHGLILMPLI